jgi:hypothetical protein
VFFKVLRYEGPIFVDTMGHVIIGIYTATPMVLAEAGVSQRLRLKYHKVYTDGSCVEFGTAKNGGGRVLDAKKSLFQ